MTSPLQLPDQKIPVQDVDQPVENHLSVSDSVIPPRPAVLSLQQEEEDEPFYVREEQPDVLGVPFVSPFQISNALPTLAEPLHQDNDQRTDDFVSPPAPLPAKKASRWAPFLSLKGLAIIVCTFVIMTLVFINALAQRTPPLQQPPVSQMNQKPTPLPTKPVVAQAKPTMIPPSGPTDGTTAQGQNQNLPPTEWVPQQLPAGWTDAGLQTGDGIEALQTAVTFTDREMSLDYRSVGTRKNHGGTLTAATFLLTPAAKERFVQNDVRMINNVLFDSVQQTSLIRLVVDPQPALVSFLQMGQQQFAWVDVRFQFWISKHDPNNTQKLLTGKEIDPNTKQPRIHHMMVLLLRVSPQNEGGDAPVMGGMGWLVSNYDLDLPGSTPLMIVQPA